MIFVSLGSVLLFLVGVLVCVKHDAPESYAVVRRMVVACVLALMLATGVIVYAAEVKIYNCNDYEKYSFIWYYELCFLYEHSS